MALFVIVMAILLASVGLTVYVMNRSAKSAADHDDQSLVKRHPLALNPVFWTYAAAAVIAAVVILMVYGRWRTGA